MLLHPRLVELHDVGAGGEQIEDFGVDRGGETERHRLRVAIEVVLRLFAHGERAGDGHLDRPIGVGAQHF